jgi:serine phosphatase RsbU (regulator of sigma subunit)/transposase
VLEVSWPVRIAADGVSVELGRVLVGLKASDLGLRYRAALQHLLLVGAAILLGGSLLIFLLVNLFVRPIQQLTEGVLAIGDGVLEKDIEVQGPEEISTIAAAFNEIAGKFRHAQAHLVEQERLQKEMQLAREIQHTLLPKDMPELSGYETAAMYRAAAEVGGDYYDFFTVDEDTTGIVVADVSGKGIPGSLVMTMIRTALRMEARGNHSASDVMARVNTFITEDMRKGMFITLFYIILDSRNRVVSYASAGHNPMLLFRSETDEVFFLNPRGFPVGISLPDPDLFARTIDVEKLQLQQDDLLLIYTDGVTEAMNAGREQYGEQRLIACMREHAGKSASEFIDALNADVAAFTGAHPQNDDITVVAIKEKLRPANLEIERRKRLLDMVEVEGMEMEEACRVYGVSVSTFYRWRRIRDKKGEEALAGKTASTGLRRLNVEERELLLGLVREDPALGARRLAGRLTALGRDVTGRMVYEELVRLDLSNEDRRRRYLRKRGWVVPEGGGEGSIAPGETGLDRTLQLDPEQTREVEEPEEAPLARG